MKMMRKYSTVLFAAVVCICVAVTVARLSDKSEGDHFTVNVVHAGTVERIRPWVNEANEMFVFLPAYADLQSVEFFTDVHDSVYLDGQEIERFDNFAKFELGQQYPLTYTISGRRVETTLTFLQSADIATIHIDTQTGNLEYVHASKENSENARVRLYYADGTTNYVGESVSIKGRGNATWQHDKKPYNIRLEREENLLGMGDADKWVLLANAFDESNIRNKLVYDTAAEYGLDYCPDSQWVDLYTNGEYRGLYLLCEANEIQKNRIVIDENQGFLVSLETEQNMQSQNLPYINTQSGQCIRIRESSVGEEELLALWQSIENALMADDGIDPITGIHYSQILDVDALARKYLIEEIFGNLDAFRASSFFYQKENGVVCAGPVWDFDKAIGNKEDTRYHISSPDVLVVTRAEDWKGMGGQWIKSLVKNEYFEERYVDIFKNEMNPLIVQDVCDRLDAYVSYLETAHHLNWIRWNSDKRYQPLSEVVKEIEEYVITAVTSAPRWMRRKKAMRER